MMCGPTPEERGFAERIADAAIEIVELRTENTRLRKALDNEREEYHLLMMSRDAMQAERDRAVADAEEWRRRADERGNVYRKMNRLRARVEELEEALDTRPEHVADLIDYDTMLERDHLRKIAEANARRLLEVADERDHLRQALDEVHAVAKATKGTQDLTEVYAMFDHIEGIARRALERSEK